MSEPLDMLGKMLLGFGLLMALFGAVMLLMSRLTSGGLPGDIVIRRPGLVIYIPLASAIIVSVLLSLILSIVAMLRR